MSSRVNAVTSVGIVSFSKALEINALPTPCITEDAVGECYIATARMLREWNQERIRIWGELKGEWDLEGGACADLYEMVFMLDLNTIDAAVIDWHMEHNIDPNDIDDYCHDDCVIKFG